MRCRTKKKKKNNLKQVTPLVLFSNAALLLPGLLQPGIAHADEDDSVDFQYSHYQEGKRDGINRFLRNPITGVYSPFKIPNPRNPIEVDSLHGGAKVSLTDRIKFAFNYNEDTWSGATPLGSAPASSTAIGLKALDHDTNGNPTIAGASPYSNAIVTFDSQGNHLPLLQLTP